MNAYTKLNNTKKRMGFVLGIKLPLPRRSFTTTSATHKKVVMSKSLENGIHGLILIILFILTIIDKKVGVCHLEGSFERYPN